MLLFNCYLKDDHTARANARLSGKVVPILNFALLARSIGRDRATAEGRLRQWIKSLPEAREALCQAWQHRQWDQMLGHETGSLKDLQWDHEKDPG